MKILIFTVLIIITFSYSGFSQEEEENCTTAGCHTVITSKINLHSALDEGCTSCHEQNYKDHPSRLGKEFNITEELPDLCYNCHDEPAPNKVVHDAVLKGKCTACHSPHSSNFPSLLKSETPEDLCRKCHNINPDKNYFEHGPVASGQCLSCHEPHQSQNKILLKKLPPQLCLSCHKEKKELLKMETVHKAYKESCLNCHLPHNSKEEKLIKYKIADLCYGCHKNKKDEITKSKIIHKVINTKESCTSCHSPHATNTNTLLKKEDNVLCLSCHNKEYKDGDNTIINIADKLKNSKYQHEAVESGSCTDCHQPHSSDINYLLNNDFPFGNYIEGPKAEKFALCFDCHDSDALVLPKTTTATGFRNGNNNLHFLHISKNKGRNCTLCHSIHGADNPHIIASKVKFGDWQMPLKYKVKEDGGSCSPGCHSERSYKNK